MATKTNRKPGPTKKAERNGPPPASNSEILTLAEAASFLRVPEKGLEADAVAGRVPARLVAGEWRFSRDALLEWLRQPETKPKSSKERLLALAGMWKDDPTVDEMVEEIYRQRKAQPIGG
jgi:hypothetical protein